MNESINQLLLLAPRARYITYLIIYVQPDRPRVSKSAEQCRGQYQYLTSLLLCIRVLRILCLRLYRTAVLASWSN